MAVLIAINKSHPEILKWVKRELGPEILYFPRESRGLFAIGKNWMWVVDSDLWNCTVIDKITLDMPDKDAIILALKWPF